MSDALPLPPRPNLEQYRKRAKDLAKLCRSGDPEKLKAWVKDWIENLIKLYGLDIALPLEHGRQYTPAMIEDLAERGVRRIAKSLRSPDPSRSNCTLAQAQFVLARQHGFASWPKFARHLEGLSQPRSPVAEFESAVDAIVNGDLSTLKKMLTKNPKLARARSTREHCSTLLHYVSANGVEDFRQKTPKNIIEITRLLLEAGADVNAESGAYRGGSRTLGLTATSVHPEEAGVQLPLMDLLIKYGADIDGDGGGNAVNDCLHNGRGDAAEFYASRGGKLDLEGAAGVGRLDVVKGFFDEQGRLKPPATRQQMIDGFAWACEFGKPNVIDFLLSRGVAVDTRLRHDGQIGLHWAAYNGHVDSVKLLLERGSPVDFKDESYKGTPLGWALYGWGNAVERRGLGRYYEVVALLVRAGAKIDESWFVDDEDRQRASRRAKSDKKMMAALAGEPPGGRKRKKARNGDGRTER
jgi:ankyrin repeat protein